MPVAVTHQFVSPVADEGDPNEVGPNEWNAEHTISGLGTAAEADSTDFATAAQGAKADTALQSADIANMLETSDIGVTVQGYDADLAAWAGVNPSAYSTTAQIAAAYQPLDASLTAYAALVTAADKAVYYSGADVPVTYDITAYGRTLAGLADETALEALLDTLPNLTSIQGRTVTLADAGADALFGWDDSANAYQNLSGADALAALGITSTATELNYTDGVTSAIQTQMDGKVGGSTGSTDNAIPRADGTAGKTLQSSGVVVDDSNNLSGVVAISSTGVLTVQNGAASGTAILGADVNASTITTATRKLARFAVPPYTNGQSPTFLFGGDNDGTNNNVYFGGVGTSGALQFATYIAFQTAAALNTSTGTTWLDIDRNGFVRSVGSFGRGVPVTKTADFTVAATENNLINNKSGSACVVTLPSASTYPGREILIKTIQAQQTNSASSNVVPLAGGAAGTAILSANAGRWAKLVSNGTNWEIMAGVI